MMVQCRPSIMEVGPPVHRVERIVCPVLGAVISPKVLAKPWLNKFCTP